MEVLLITLIIVVIIGFFILGGICFNFYKINKNKPDSYYLTKINSKIDHINDTIAGMKRQLKVLECEHIDCEYIILDVISDYYYIMDNYAKENNRVYAKKVCKKCGKELARLTKKEYLAEQKAILENKLGKKLEVVEEKNVPRRKARKRSR